LPNEIDLLAALCMARPPEAAELKALIGAGFDWPLFRELAERNAVVALVVKRLKALDLPVPDAWLTTAARVAESGAKRHEWALKAYAQWKRAGISVIVLKGGLFGTELYGDPAYKKMNDVDVLLPHSEIERALAQLTAIGFKSTGDVYGEGKKSGKNHHTPPYYSPDHSCMIGIHWQLCSPYLPWKPDSAAIWARSVPSQIPGARRMSWEDNLMHLCVHLPFLKTGVRELADVYNLVLCARPRIDWAKVREIAAAWRAEDAVYRVLSLADALMPLNLPAGLLEGWREKASAFTRADTELKLAKPLALARSRSAIIGAIERQAVFLRVSAAPRERMAAFVKKWAIFLLPPAAEAEKLANAEAPLGPLALAWARVRAPGRIWRAMARDYGRKALWAMTAINAALFAKACADLVRGRGGARLSVEGRRMVEAAE
jgi:hypothetical protein